MDYTLSLKASYEHGNLLETIEFFNENKNIIHDLPLVERLKCLFYFINSFMRLGRGNEVSKIAASNEISIVYQSAENKFHELLNTILQYLLAPRSDKCRTLINQKFNQLDNLLDQFNEDEKIVHAEWIGFLLIHIGYSYSSFNSIIQKEFNPEKALQYFNKSLELAKEANFRFGLVRSYTAIENLQVTIQNYDLAKEAALNSLKLAQQYNYKEQELVALGNLADIAVNVGDLENVIIYVTEALKINKSVKKISYLEILLGNAYSMKGELQKALTYYQESYETFKQNNLLSRMNSALVTLAKHYYLIGDLDKAEDYYLQVLAHSEMESIVEMYELLYYLITIYLEENQKDLVEKYHNQLKSNLQTENFKYTDFYLKITQALIYKFSKRYRLRTKAQDLYQEILTSEIPNNLWRIHILTHQTELLFDEFQLLGATEVLSEIRQILSQLYEIGLTTYQYNFLFNIVILEAKINLFEENFDEASRLYEFALQLSEEKKLDNLKKKIVAEIEKKENFINNMPRSLQEKIRTLNMEFYLIEARKMIDPAINTN